MYIYFSKNRTNPLYEEGASMVIISTTNADSDSENAETKVLQDILDTEDAVRKNSNKESNAMTSSSSGYSSNRVPLPQLNNNITTMGKINYLIKGNFGNTQV